MTTRPTPAMTIEQAIIDWAQNRHVWQRDILRRCARNEDITQGDLEALLAHLIEDTYTAGTALAVSDFIGAEATEATVQLTSIGSPENINALLNDPDKPLKFGDTGLTIVFGQNGSGKSGYARIIREVVSARDRKPVHPNVYAATQQTRQSAQVSYAVNGSPETRTWKDGIGDDLRAIRFYDNLCGQHYVNKAETLSYRPSALTAMDGLVQVCNTLRSLIDERIRTLNEQREQLPQLTTGTPAAQFLETLSASTTTTQIDVALQRADDLDAQLKVANDELARLTNSDPTRERARLNDLATAASSIAAHTKQIWETLSADSETALVDAEKDAYTKRQAAQAASAVATDTAPLPGIGQEAWITLWKAARDYSTQIAYHGHSYPHTGDDALCVYCQQPLYDDAKERLDKFDEFMSGQAESAATQAEQSLTARKNAISSLVVETPAIAAAMAKIEAHEADKQRVTGLRTWLQQTNARKLFLAKPAAERATEAASPSLESVHDAWSRWATALPQQAAVIDEAAFGQQKTQATQRRDALHNQKALCEASDAVRREHRRLTNIDRLNEVKSAADPSVITRKGGDLTTTYADAAVQARFRIECDTLEVHRVGLTRGTPRDGQATRRPSLQGTTITAPITDILSEGEHTALGLAGFFTEVHFATSKSGVVFDDPTTSLDHVRRSRIATRIAELASERQVVVFTHDIGFVIDLQRSARSVSITPVCRSIERRGSAPGVPGACAEFFPWSATDTPQRLNELKASAERLRTNRQSMTTTDYEDAAVAWAGKLSQTWERMLRLDVVNHVVDPGKGEVHPNMTKVLTRFTADDQATYDLGYGKTSAWARRHDPDPNMQFVAPEPDVLLSAYEEANTWHARVKRYRNG